MKQGKSRALVGGMTLVACLFVTAGHSRAAETQTSSEVAAKAQARLLQLDVNRDSVLSGTEVVACSCKEYDTDRDGQITKAEFYLGFMVAAFEAQQPKPAAAAAPMAAAPTVPAPIVPATANVPNPAGGGRFVIGDRVELLVGEIWYPGVIYDERGGHYAVNRDNFGRARFDEGQIRHEQRPVMMSPAPPDNLPLTNGERVQVDHRAVSYSGNIGVHEMGTNIYFVDRYNTNAGVSVRSEEVLVGDIRRLLPTTARRPAGPFPASVMPGLYICNTNAGRNTTTIGRLRIVGPGTYTGITPDGSGAQGRYTYDRATGKIEFADGLTSLKVIMLTSFYNLTNSGFGEISLNYKIAADRFDLQTYCNFEGR